jgi:hypothetical protein
MGWATLLTGGLAKRIGGIGSMTGGSPHSGVATDPSSPPTLPEIGAAATMVQLDQMMQRDRHAMSMAQAQLREQFGKNWEQPDDVGIQWNSPTIVNPPKPGLGMLAKLAVGAGLLGGGVGLGMAIPWLTGNLSRDAVEVVTPLEDSDTRYRLGLGEPDE